MRKQFTDIVKNFARDESGASMVEYAVLIAIITSGLVLAISTLGEEIAEQFNAMTALIGANRPGT
jgi:Flp pilus assembly pilin Flp